jgi:hypothetical protein
MKARAFIAFLLAPLIGWAAYALLAHRVAILFSQRWGQRLVRAGDGKFSDAAVFLQHRFYEGAWLLTLTVVLTLAVFATGALLARRLTPIWKWVPFSLIGFVGVNVWLKFATATCLFWCLFWNGKGTTNNLTQFHIKLLLMNENPAPMKVVLAGSSQVRAQIDTRILNSRFGSNIFTTELHFPGNRCYDLLLLDHKLQGHKADVILCYLSELNFFDGPLGDGSAFFFNFRDLPELFELGGQLRWSPRALAYGLLGETLPVFWIREPIPERVLGVEVSGIRQKGLDAALASDLAQRAVEAAAGYRSDAGSDFSFRAFEVFVAKCRSQHRMVIACCGQVNPILARRLNPALRAQMRAFLRNLAANYDNLVFLDEGDLPREAESDYEDLTHITAEARVRFTEALEPVLQRLMLTKKQSSGKAG